jgi:8-oxo-dGTP diphosphatase
MSFTYEYPHMAVTVDVVLFDLSTKNHSVLLIKREKDPFIDHWALPGGYVDMEEKIKTAAFRELAEETGAIIDSLEFLDFFDDIYRDPRERTVSFAYWATTTKIEQNILAADDASDAKWHLIESLPKLAFDHKNIVDIAIKKIRS